MTLNHKVLKKVNSPKRSPKLANSTLRRRTLLKRLSSGGVQFGTSSKANLKVVVRVRPENQREIESNARSVVDIVDDHMLVFDPKPEENDFFFQGAKQKFRDLSKKQHKEQKFIFEKVFNPLSTNQDVFETTTRDIIDTILNGYNCSVFAYGATGSGKTFTMIGTEDYPGITFMTVMELYKKLGELENKTCEVGVSYLEVYNEMVRDLLAPGKPLNLHETKQNVQVTGLSLHKPKDADELLRILAEGNRNRSQHPTDANSESSRSHAVFQVFVKQQNMSEGATTGVSIAKLSMIDLAGSERGSATGFKGVRFREGANINKSLLALGNCINALADGKGHIPYRDSKLTRLLKDSIGGNCRSVMIATITQASLSFEDTYNTLRYANRAKTIKTTLKKNFMNVDHHVAQYVKIMEDLKSEIADLKEKLKEYEREPIMPASEVLVSPSLSEDERKAYEDVIEELKQQLKAKTAQEREEVEYEKELLSKLTSLNAEVKAIQKEILQLETSERDLDYKIYTHRAQIVRMNVFVFASKKLEKGISKCERLIQAFQKNLNHVINHKQSLTEKFAKLKEQIVTLCEDFKKKKCLSQPESEDDMSDPLLSKLRDMEMEQTVRNSMQIQNYLSSLVQNLLQKEANSEKLFSLLLVTVKHFYLKFKLQKTCDEEVDQFLEKIYGMLDCSRIEWADLKNTKDSFGEKIASDYVTLVPILDDRKLTDFQVPHTVHFSPITYDVSKIYKSNILKPISDHEPTLNHYPCVLNETFQMETPVSSKKFSSLKVTPLSHKENMDNEKVFSDSILENDVLKSPNATFSVNDNSSPLCLPIESSTQEVEDTTTVENYSQHQEESQTACSSEKEVFTPQPPLSPVFNFANTTITITKNSPESDKETCVKKDDDTVFCTDDNPSKASVNSDELSPALVISDDPSQSLVNSTFSILNPENTTTTTYSPKITGSTYSPKITGSTYSPKITGSHSPRITSTHSPMLTTTHSPRERVTSLQSIQNNVFKKPMGITSSKFSFSKLPNFSSGKPQTSLSLKRSTSTSVLHSGGVENSCGKSQIGYSSGSNKENVLKKSTSFVQKNGSNSTLKNKENKGVKTVAFGSSYSGTPRMKLSSKRSLTYSQLPNVTTEQLKK